MNGLERQGNDNKHERHHRKRIPFQFCLRTAYDDKIKQCFTRNQYILNIDFSTIGGKQDYWNRNMSMHNYETAQYEVGRTVYLNADFMVRVRQEKFGVINSTAICIRSTTSEKLPDGYQYYYTNNGQSVYIPTISIR